MRGPIIKICGVTSPADAMACADLGVDLLGLNFWPGSPRHVEVERARAVADAVRGRLELVGVFVNQSGDEVEEIEREVGLDRLQFHGDESFDDVRRFGGRALKAFRVDPAVGFDGKLPGRYAEAWGFLFDVAGDGAYGGTGTSWPYEMIASLVVEKPTLVAGGVSPENAREALERSRTRGVDVCSGVESAPGVKDRDALERLVEAVRRG